MKLKINKILFKWYYKRCGDHFAQWTFIKSVKMLIQNYDHMKLLMKNEEKHNLNLTRDNDKLRKELFDIRINQIASENTIDILNSSFRVGIRKNSEN